MVGPATLERYLAGFEAPSGEGETVVDQGWRPVGQPVGGRVRFD